MPTGRHRGNSNRARPRTNRLAAFGIAACVLAAAVDAFFIEPRRLVLERVDIPIFNLPEAFDGYRIALLADLHYPRWADAAFVHKAVALANYSSPISSPYPATSVTN